MTAKTIVVIVALATLASANLNAQTTPVGVFQSMTACEASTAVYTPAFLSGHKPLGPGEFRAQLGRRQCGRLTIAGGRLAIVGQSAETEMVWRGDLANAVSDRRWDCGNGAKGFRLIPSAPALIPVGVTAGDLNVHVDGQINVVHSGSVSLLPAESVGSKTSPASGGTDWWRIGRWTLYGGLAAGAVYGGHELWESRHSVVAGKAPDVTTDSAVKTKCTTLPCTGTPPVVGNRIGLRNGFQPTFDPFKKSVGFVGKIGW